MDTWYLSKIKWELPHDSRRTGKEKMSEIRVVSGEIAFMPHVETNHLLLLLIIVLYPKMITVYRIWEMVSFELGEEIEKDVFRLVISVGQRENLSLFLYWFQNLPSPLFYLQTWRYRHCWSKQNAERVASELRIRPLCSSVVAHRGAESVGLRFDSSWGFRIFSLSHARDKTKNMFLCEQYTSPIK